LRTSAGTGGTLEAHPGRKKKRRRTPSRMDRDLLTSGSGTLLTPAGGWRLAERGSEN